MLRSSATVRADDRVKLLSFYHDRATLDGSLSACCLATDRRLAQAISYSLDGKTRMHTPLKRIESAALSNRYTAKAWLVSRRLYYSARALVVSDEAAVRRSYLRRIGEALDLADPKGFNEKLAWLKLNNRDPLQVRCADKVLVRQYVRDNGLEGILNEVYGVYDSANDIDFASLPASAFIKTNHGSGTNVLWRASQPFDIGRVRMELNEALRTNYYHKSREWPYSHIMPKIVVEKVLDDAETLVDFRFLCFDGEAKVIFADIETTAPDGTHNPGARRNLYDREFNLIGATVGRSNFPTELITKPTMLTDMIAIAEQLSTPFAFCRVDLYNVQGKIIFGEMTFYPGSGGQKVTPPEWDMKLGSWIDLESPRIVRAP